MFVIMYTTYSLSIGVNSDLVTARECLDCAQHVMCIQDCAVPLPGLPYPKSELPLGLRSFGGGRCHRFGNKQCFNNCKEHSLVDLSFNIIC